MFVVHWHCQFQWQKWQSQWQNHYNLHISAKWSLVSIDNFSDKTWEVIGSGKKGKSVASGISGVIWVTPNHLLISRYAKICGKICFVTWPYEQDVVLFFNFATPFSISHVHIVYNKSKYSYYIILYFRYV